MGRFDTDNFDFEEEPIEAEWENWRDVDSPVIPEPDHSKQALFAVHYGRFGPMPDFPPIEAYAGTEDDVAFQREQAIREYGDRLSSVYEEEPCPDCGRMYCQHDCQEPSVGEPEDLPTNHPNYKDR